MGELKFRAWIGRTQAFSYFTLENILERRASLIESDWDMEVLRAPKTQYIGLKDKNGKEIYGGDIIKFYIPAYELKWMSSQDLMGTEPQNSCQICTHATYPIRCKAAVVIQDPVVFDFIDIYPYILDIDKDFDEYKRIQPDEQGGGADGLEINLEPYYKSITHLVEDNCWQGGHYSDWKEIEVIGNIYENLGNHTR